MVLISAQMLQTTVGTEQGRFLGVTGVIWWWHWRCGFAGTIAAFLLSCWVPLLARGDMAASPGFWQHQVIGRCPWIAHVLSLAMWN